MIMTEAIPIRYIRPGPPRKTNPLNAADIVAIVRTTQPTFCPAMKKSRGVLVRRPAQIPITVTNAR